MEFDAAITVKTPEPKTEVVKSIFTTVLDASSKLSDGVCLIISNLCEAICGTGRFVFQCLFVLSTFAAITAWRHGPTPQPQMLMAICCLGVMVGNLGQVAVGRRELADAVRLPGALALLVYFMPVEAISAAIKAF